MTTRKYQEKIGLLSVKWNNFSHITGNLINYSIRYEDKNNIVSRDSRVSTVKRNMILP